MGIEGWVGNFQVKILKMPRYVDEEKCTGCGLCAEVCPISILDEFNMNLGARKAAWIQFPQAVPLKYKIDRELCMGCTLCKVVCESKAIDFEQKPEEIQINVGAIIVATGYDLMSREEIENMDMESMLM